MCAATSGALRQDGCGSASTAMSRYDSRGVAFRRGGVRAASVETLRCCIADMCAGLWMGCLAVAADRSLTPRILPLSCSDVNRLWDYNRVSPLDSLCKSRGKAAQCRAFAVTLFVSLL